MKWPPCRNRRLVPTTPLMIADAAWSPRLTAVLLRPAGRTVRQSALTFREKPAMLLQAATWLLKQGFVEFERWRTARKDTRRSRVIQEAIVRYGRVLILITVFCTGPSLAVRAQIPHLACAPGQVPQPIVQPDRTVKYGCAAAHPMNRDLPGTSTAQACSQDSDCPSGPDRCLAGACMRLTMRCQADTDCKYSEECDASRELCVPRGGQY
jgi:hypothetical protein